MGMDLIDQKSNKFVFSANFWHWRAIVEAVRRLKVIPDDRAELLHEAWAGELTEDEARLVAVAIRERLLPALNETDRLLLDGHVTTEPDDGTMHYDPAEQHKNYSTDRRVLEEFAACCETCNGFRVS